MGKITIRNKSAAVQVLKCLGLATLRLFPGYNQVDEGDFKKYMKGNPAVKGMVEEHLRPVEDPSVAQAKEAAKAEAKNAELNRAKKIIKKTDAALTKSEQTVSDQEGLIKDQWKTIEALTKRLEALEKKPADKKAKDK